MIKANELRIYNYVYDYYWCNTKRKYCSDIIKLKKIANTYVVCCKDDDERKAERKNRLMYCYDDIKPIPLTEELFLKCYIDDVKLERWGNKVVNEHEYYTRYVLHNVVDGSSNIEIRLIHSNYGDKMHLEYKIYIDDEPQGYKELEYLHQLQNGIFWITGKELEINL